MLKTSNLLNKENTTNELFDLNKFNPDLKSHEVAENAASKYIEYEENHIKTFLSVYKDLEVAQQDLKEKWQKLNESSLPFYDDMSEEPNEEYEDTITHEYKAAYQKFYSLLEDNNLKEWLNNLLNSYSSRTIENLFPSNDSTITEVSILPSLINKELKGTLFVASKRLYENFGLTTLRPSIIKNNLLPSYLYLLRYFKDTKNGSKKANVLINKMITLKNKKINRDNFRETSFLYHSTRNWEYSLMNHYLGKNDYYTFSTSKSLFSNTNRSITNKREKLMMLDDELSDDKTGKFLAKPIVSKSLVHQISQNINSITLNQLFSRNNCNELKYQESTYLGPLDKNERNNVTPKQFEIFVKYSVAHPYYRMKFLRKSTLEEIDFIVDKVKRNVNGLRKSASYSNRISIYKESIKNYSEDFVYMVATKQENLLLSALEPSLRNMLLLEMIGYDNYSKLLTFFIDNNVDVHTFLDNMTYGSISNLYKEDEQKALFKYLKRLRKKQPNEISRLIGFFGYKKARASKNMNELEGYISMLQTAKKGFITGKTNPSEMLIDDCVGNNLIFYTKDDSEINTIGSRTGCCFTPSGLAKSLVRISKLSPLAGIVEGKHGRRNSDWFAFVWELVEYNETTKTFETALVLDNIESLNIISYEDWNEIYKWLLKTPYNKVYLGTMRNDISSDIFSPNADPTDLTDAHINRDTIKGRSRQIIYYEKGFNSYHYDDSKNVYTVIDRTSRCPRKLGVTKITTSGEFHRLLYTEGLVWGGNSDYDVLRNLKYNQSPSYLVRDSLGNIYGYMVTRLYKINEETKKITYDDNLKVKKDTLEEGEDYVLYLDDIFITKNVPSMKALSLMVENILIYTKENNIKYVSAHFNQYSEKFLKRIKNAGVEFVEDTRFNDNGTESKIKSVPSKLLQGHKERLEVKTYGFDKKLKSLRQNDSDED